MNPVEQARAVLADLTTKRDELEARQVMLAQGRDELAYDAHVGDEKARTKLTRLHKELVEIGAEMAGYVAAIRTAETKVLEAQGVARADIDRQGGEQALKLGREMDAAKAADKALTQAFTALNDLRAATAQLNRIGAPPAGALVESGLLRALKTRSMASKFLVLEHLSPGERRTVMDLAERWAANVEDWAAQRLGKAVKKEAA